MKHADIRTRARKEMPAYLSDIVEAPHDLYIAHVDFVSDVDPPIAYVDFVSDVALLSHTLTSLVM